MKVKEDYVHDVVQRLTEQDGRERQIIWRGTSEQIAERVAESVKYALDHGDSKVIRLEPTAPYNIFNLARN